MSDNPNYITVGELRSMISDLHPDLPIVLQKDPEGNGYQFLSGVDPNCSWADGKYEVEIGVYELTDKLRSRGYTQEDIVSSDQCVVLFP